MKLIKPAEISGKIMTLIDEAKKELIIVSPYNKITGWGKLINRIKKAQARGVQITWYSRGNGVKPENVDEVVRNLGITPVLVEDLHAKIYMNDYDAIFTSMNMCEPSDEKSIDLGYITENKEEYDEILDVFNKHINQISIQHNKEKPPPKAERIVVREKASFINISNLFYINGIYNHILFNYGKFRFKKTEDGFMEYSDFIKQGFKLQLITYDQAIKILICPPKSTSLEIFDKNLSVNKKQTDLIFKDELECYYHDHQIKYYYKSNLKISEWGKNQLKFFLADLDTIIRLVFNKGYSSG